MRQKKYYSDTEITPNLYTFGKEYQTESGVEYKGLYHKYITGEVYTQPMWNAQLSKKLVIYKPVTELVSKYNTLNEQKLNSKTPTTVLRNPTTQERKDGFMLRYFLKKINDATIFEIDQAQSKEYQQKIIDNNLYLYTTIRWYITGQIEDIQNGSVLVEGIITKNKKQLIQAERVIPGMIKQYTDLIQYYTDISYVVPKDING
jgi:hypothetical protein